MVRWWIRWFGVEVPSPRFGGSTPGLLWTLLVCLFHLGFLDSSWTTVDSGPITDADTSAWSFSFPVLVKFVAFLSTPRLPEGLDEMGKIGIFFFFFKRSFFLTGGLGTVFFLRKRCLCITTLESRCLWAVTVQIRVSCIFWRNMFRSRARLPGGLARFLPCGVGSHVSRLRHIGWLQCGHSHLGSWNPVFLVALIPCWTFWDTHPGPPRLQQTAPFGKDIAPLPLHPGFAPGCGLWSGVGSFQQA